ncbi:MAG: ABC transporter [Deltaproteobacteria bacterium RIFOXYA12_FULL_58_15]|nr:MAG: ABC transporter [Deltaproteobacteria bacterium RIFOXYA12_FULL_58_15]OGR12709.1 MAG: ABC transporter [Deltaproteobacteria bacterium RIFOXYB12_FULL_58_9]
MSDIVQLNNVVKEYALGKTVVRALRGVSLTLARGEFIAVAGPSGSGKTTLLNLIGCVDKATSGTVTLDGAETNTLDDHALTELRLHKLGFVFQSFNLIQVLNVYQNVEFPILLQGTSTGGERHRMVEEIIDRVGLKEYLRHRPNELSGGQRQRVAIARALVGKPMVVLADEPTGNLDSKTGQSIIDLMKQMNREEQTTFIFSTHDPRVMEQAQRVIELVDGQITANGAQPAKA